MPKLTVRLITSILLIVIIVVVLTLTYVEMNPRIVYVTNTASLVETSFVTRTSVSISISAIASSTTP